MTREEAIALLRLGPGINEDVSEEYNEAVNMAIEALQQQPSEDCISRKFMHDMGATCIAARNKDGDLVALGALDILPSATPQPKTGQQKTGHWIEHNGALGIPHIECSECSCWFLKSDLPHNSYCPNCGSRNHWLKMQEVD